MDPAAMAAAQAGAMPFPDHLNMTAPTTRPDEPLLTGVGAGGPAPAVVQGINRSPVAATFARIAASTGSPVARQLADLATQQGL